MKTKKLVLAGLIALIVMPFVAAEAADKELTLAAIESDRQQLVALAVQPSKEQDPQFWDTYWAYRKEVTALNERTKKVITEYADGYASLTDEQATRLVKEAAAIDAARAAAKKECTAKMQKILLPKQVLRFLQIENKMDALIGLDLVAAIPFDV